MVAVDLVEGLADVDTSALQLDMHHGQAVDQHSHVIAVRVAPPAGTLRAGHLVLVDDLQTVVVDVDLVDEHDVLGRAVVASEQLDVVLVDAHGLVDDAGVRAGDPLGEEALPFGIGEPHAVERLKLVAQVGDELALSGDGEVGVGLLLQLAEERLLETGFRLVCRVARRSGDELGDDGAFGADCHRLVADGTGVGGGVGHGWSLGGVAALSRARAVRSALSASAAETGRAS